MKESEISNYLGKKKKKRDSFACLEAVHDENRADHRHDP